MKIFLSENLKEIERWIFPDVNSIKNNPLKHKKSTTTSQNEVNPAEDIKVEHGEDIYEKAWQEGVQKGYQEGLEIAKKEAFQQAKEESFQLHEKEWNQNKSILNKIISNLTNPMHVLDEQLEHEIINLIMTVTKRLFYHELEIKPEQVLSIIRQAVKMLPTGTKKVELIVNPEDLSLIKEVLQGENFNNIKADEKLKRGDVIFKADDAVIDASFEKRLVNIADQVFKNEY